MPELIANRLESKVRIGVNNGIERQNHYHFPLQPNCERTKVTYIYTKNSKKKKKKHHQELEHGQVDNREK